MRFSVADRQKAMDEYLLDRYQKKEDPIIYQFFRKHYIRLFEKYQHVYGRVNVR